MPDERREARERAQSLESWSRRSRRRAIHNLLYFAMFLKIVALEAVHFIRSTFHI